MCQNEEKVSNFTGNSIEMDYSPETKELIKTLRGVSELKQAILNRSIAKKLLDEGLIEIKGRKTSGQWILNPEEFKTGKKSKIENRHFSAIINAISPKFENIFNEATMAYNEGMTEICGGGYRKALEFLIFDYLVKKNPEDEDRITNIGQLANALVCYIHDDLLMKSIEAAAWVGNDTLHYKIKYKDLGIPDLIEYISDVVKAIEVIETGEDLGEILPNLHKKLEEKITLMPDLGLSPKERKKLKKKSQEHSSDTNE